PHVTAGPFRDRGPGAIGDAVPRLGGRRGAEALAGPPARPDRLRELPIRPPVGLRGEPAPHLAGTAPGGRAPPRDVPGGRAAVPNRACLVRRRDRLEEGSAPERLCPLPGGRPGGGGPRLRRVR